MKPTIFHNGERTSDARGWFKTFRSEEALELIGLNPLAYVLLAVIAHRARWREGFNRHGLALDEALLGDYDNYGMTEREYRTAKSQLEKAGFATFRKTNRGTIAKLADTRIFSIRAGADDHQSAMIQASNCQRSDGQMTTNKELKQIKKEQSNNNKEQQHAADESCVDQYQTRSENNSGEPLTGSEAANVDVEPEVDFWNKNADQKLTRVQALTNERATLLNQARKNSFWSENFKRAVMKLACLDYCLGGGPNGWKADFTWMLDPSNVAKVIEGFYDNREIKPNPRDVQRQLDEVRKLIEIHPCNPQSTRYAGNRASEAGVKQYAELKANEMKFSKQVAGLR
jgi:hypothetical protein